MKPLLRMLRKNQLTDDIRDSLSNMVKYVLQRDYILGKHSGVYIFLSFFIGLGGGIEKIGKKGREGKRKEGHKKTKCIKKEKENCAVFRNLLNTPVFKSMIWEKI